MTKSTSTKTLLAHNHKEAVKSFAWELNKVSFFPFSHFTFCFVPFSQWNYAQFCLALFVRVSRTKSENVAFFVAAKSDCTRVNQWLLILLFLLRCQRFNCFSNLKPIVVIGNFGEDFSFVKVFLSFTLTCLWTRLSRFLVCLQPQILNWHVVWQFTPLAS